MRMLLFAAVVVGSACTAKLSLVEQRERSNAGQGDAAASLTDALVGADAGGALPFVLALPLACTPGEDCALVYYYDLDSSQGALRDYGCGTRTLDGHSGTTFALRDAVQMEQGVAVTAAAAGDVVALDAVGNGSCGIELTIDHGQGWRTRYCHLRPASLVVKIGDTVGRGERVGDVGISGDTGGVPQIYFELSRDGVPLDPFSGLSSLADCSSERYTSLWTPQVTAELPYAPAVIHFGLTDELFDSSNEDDLVRLRSAIFAGGLRAESIAPNADALLLYVQLIGVERNDSFRTRIVGPAGDEIYTSGWVTLPGDWVVFTHISGLRRGDQPWPAGEYRGEFELKRHDGASEPGPSSKGVTAVVP